MVCLVAGSAWQRDICLVLSLHAYWEHETLWLLRCGHLDPCPFAELDMGDGRPSLWSSPVHQGLAGMEGQGCLWLIRARRPGKVTPTAPNS